MGIFGRFSKPRPEARPRSPTGAGDPQNRRRSMGYNPTAPSAELQPAPSQQRGPSRAPSAPEGPPSDDGTADQPLEDDRQAHESYAAFSEPGTPPTSRKGSTAILNSQGSLYRHHNNNSLPPANGTSAMSSGISPGLGPAPAYGFPAPACGFPAFSAMPVSHLPSSSNCLPHKQLQM